MATQIKRTARTSTLTYPKTFRVRQIATNGTKLYVRVGGSGPTVVLLHGYGETGDMWVPLAEDLAPDHTVVVVVTADRLGREPHSAQVGSA
jgi:alpha-beta hydrolase superfamily lysophospholipase